MKKWMVVLGLVFGVVGIVAAVALLIEDSRRNDLKDYLEDLYDDGSEYLLEKSKPHRRAIKKEVKKLKKAYNRNKKDCFGLCSWF